MDEDYNNDDNVWNASAVILDIDSGVLHEDLSWFWFRFFSFLKNYIKQPTFKLILICHVNGK